MKAKYSVTLNRDVETSIGHLVVRTFNQHESIIPAPTVFKQSAGPRAFRTLKDAKAFVSAQRSTHGNDVCTDPVAI